MADDKKVVVGRTRLENVRLSFAKHLFSPDISVYDEKHKKAGQEKKTWSANFLIAEDDTANIQRVKKAIKEAMVAEWKDNLPKIKAEKLAFRDGNQEEWEGYADHMYVSTNAYQKPKVFGRNPKLGEIDEASGIVYSGCRVNAIVTFWAQDSKEYGRGVYCSLEGVQFFADDEPFGTAGIDEGDFDTYDETDSFDDSNEFF